VEALIAGHEVEGLLAEVAFPGYSLVTSVGWEAFGLLTLLADDIATIEAAATAADRPHAILDEVHEAGALEAEEVVKLVWTLLTLHVLEQLERKLVAEHEEVRAAARTLNERCLRAHQLHLALGIDADYLRVHAQNVYKIKRLRHIMLWGGDPPASRK